MMHDETQDIVKRVLFELDAIKKAIVFDTLQYETCQIEKLRAAYLLENVVNVDTLIKKSDDYNKKKTTIFIPQLTCKDMMFIASGMGYNILTDSVILLLMRHFKVHVQHDKVEFIKLDPLNTPLFNKHQIAFDTLLKSGLIIEYDVVDRKRDIINYKANMHHQIDVQNIKHARKLLTESDVINYTQSGTMCIKLLKNTIITPLAKDLIRKNSIKITKE